MARPARWLRRLTVPAAALTLLQPAWAGDYPRQLLWGDTHLHTATSTDARIFGNDAVSAGEAYRFARGETVVTAGGREVSLPRPLDFLVVADHAEYYGTGERLRQQVAATLDREPGMMDLIGAYSRSLYTGTPIADVPVLDAAAWEDYCRVTEQFNTPGEFTTLVGFEWSSMPGGANLHRVVVFADEPEVACRVQPFSTFDSDRPEDLWAWMADYELRHGGEVLAIPHNANLSLGRMFALEDSEGRAFDEEYARMRARWEPLFEVVQIKGDSETHPRLSPGDRHAPQDLFGLGGQLSPTELAGNFARPALLLGLQEKDRLGANPFRFGMIGSSDSHTGLATVEEAGFEGKFSFAEPGDGASRWNIRWPMAEPTTREWQMDAAGYAAVWATANTREAIFAALQRREVYATSGSRIQLRFFAGWELAPDLLQDVAWLDAAYRDGVPMGGLLRADPASRHAPRFVVMAAADPESETLEALQIVKGWREPRTGELHEVVHDLVVDAEGQAQMAAHWVDVGYQPGQAAFYYARAVERPRPRWVALDLHAHGQSGSAPEGVPLQVRERAYSSPIWVESEKTSN